MRIGCFKLNKINTKLSALTEICGNNLLLDEPKRAASIQGRGLLKGVTLALTLDQAEKNACLKIGQALNVPWCYLMLQENSFWEVVFHRKDVPYARFSAMPENWEEDAAYISSWTIQPIQLQEVASDWCLNLEAIKNYFIPWSDVCGKGLINYTGLQKAYPTDEHPYGSVYQAFDLLKAFGSGDPSNLLQSGAFRFWVSN